MRKFIATIPANPILTGFVTAVNAAVAPFAPFKINLTTTERMGRSMAEGREGYARLVSRIANQFPNSLSRSDVPTDLVTMINYYDGLESNRLALVQALETIEEIQLGASMDTMVMVDRYVKNLQISRSNDASLDMAMKDVDDYNKRFGGNEPGANPA
ncbi:hypothetical protein [Flavobacterium sp.]|uniref:hypothetical protein n=1 Tax=Flavobacterium sp. TaxID=239 RepID=UPI00286E0F2B|nr:hypothetical protein [Flavobacterium sp.]